MSGPTDRSGEAWRRVAEATATLLMLPLIVWFRGVCAVAPGQRDRLMRGVSQLISLIPGLTGSYLRCAFYRRTLLAVGRPCYIGFGTILATADIRIGDRVYVGPFCNLGHVDVGDDVMIGSNVTVLSGRHQHGYERTDVPMNRQQGRFERVRIEPDCWLGNGSVVMVDIRGGSIVAAGAVVTASPSPMTIVGGNPARPLGTREAIGDE